MNIDELVKAVEDDTCYEHFFYNGHGNGCHWSKSSCPYCTIERLKERCHPTDVIVLNGLGHYTSKIIADTIRDLQTKLSRYEGAISVHNVKVAERYDNWKQTPCGDIQVRLPANLIGQKVTVLVMEVKEQ